MRIVLSVLVVGFAAPVAFSAHATSSSRIPTVSCGESIDRTAFPFIGDRRPRFRYRLVLGVVSVPPSFLRQVIPTHGRPWAYWHKAGLVVRATGVSVTVSVPRRWRSRAAITWGINTGIVHSLRITGCRDGAAVGDAFAGGFYLTSTSACLPLIFRSGQRTATARFGIGRTCPSLG